MATDAKFSAEQLQELAHVIKSIPRSDSEDVSQVVLALRQGAQTVFQSEEIDSIAAAISALDVPLQARPSWQGENQQAKPRGLFVVFEGLDRSGKSTQSKRLAKLLEQNGPVKWMCFPNRATPTGMLIDFYLRRQIDLSDHAVHLLFSANRWETAVAIVKDLLDGVSIVCDRYAFSGVAYSAAKGLDFTWCQAPDRGLPSPDAIFFMHIDQDEGSKRSGFGDERYENTQMQTAVRLQFENAALHSGVNWNTIDGARDMDVISKEIAGRVEAIQGINQENSCRVQPLWR